MSSAKMKNTYTNKNCIICGTRFTGLEPVPVCSSRCLYILNTGDKEAHKYDSAVKIYRERYHSDNTPNYHSLFYILNCLGWIYADTKDKTLRGWYGDIEIHNEHTTRTTVVETNKEAI